LIVPALLTLGVAHGGVSDRGSALVGGAGVSLFGLDLSREAAEHLKWRNPTVRGSELRDGRLVLLQFGQHVRHSGDRPARPSFFRTRIGSRALAPLWQARLPVGAVFDADPVAALLHLARRKRLPVTAQVESLPDTQDFDRIDDLRR